ncbi:inositol-pentakisphosphate 2-kinase [Synchytrium microbalum]|uniref:Inositol-pentakisphosphate 2-kinase n=1 Tax=Synchytrium microbalum TaxID=1806994 RepID=A0A507C783_9FUNG|nr:inositol-pentakisphosphate 2-kinase [Synchytrium microbalum]TPX33345.1 inositol-pentakisphosphate 2-kinase [Synchytrium microbalum]
MNVISEERPELLKPDLWSFRGEGNVNLVLSYIGGDHWASGMVLRLEKERKSDAEYIPSSFELITYARQTTQRLLGSKYVDSLALLQVKKDFLQDLAEMIQPLRTDHRKQQSLDTTKDVGILMRDHTQFKWPPALDMKFPSELCLELKLKWGFLPKGEVSPVKKQACRFCRMQAFRVARNKDYIPCSFCPLDVFSGDETRMVEAFQDLYRVPHTYMRAFVDGTAVDSCSDAFVTFISKFMRDDNKDSALDRLWTLAAKALKKDGILNLVKLHQSELDSLDIEVLYPLLLRHNVPLVNPNVENWKRIVETYLEKRVPSSSASAEALRQRLYEFCISTTLKDISIFVTMTEKLSDSVQPTDGDGAVGIGDQEYAFKVRVADLDLKSATKVKKYFEQDRDIVNDFVKSKSTRVCIS